MTHCQCVKSPYSLIWSRQLLNVLSAGIPLFLYFLLRGQWVNVVLFQLFHWVKSSTLSTLPLSTSHEEMSCVGEPDSPELNGFVPDGNPGYMKGRVQWDWLTVSILLLVLFPEASTNERRHTLHVCTSAAETRKICCCSCLQLSFEGIPYQTRFWLFSVTDQIRFVPQIVHCACLIISLTLVWEDVCFLSCLCSRLCL